MPARILDDPIPPADFPVELLSEVELDPPVTIERGTCELVISGVSCRLPESENMEEFEQHLMNGDDMVSEDDRRWQPGLYGLPNRSGKLKTLDKFDAAFFGVSPKQANRMDPQLRMLLEVTHEAIIDSGVATRKWWIAVNVLWHLAHKDCYGKYVHDICVFGLGDLNRLVSERELFANKFHHDYQPLALQCMEEWIYNTTFKDVPLQVYYYRILIH